MPGGILQEVSGVLELKLERIGRWKNPAGFRLLISPLGRRYEKAQRGLYVMRRAVPCTILMMPRRSVTIRWWSIEATKTTLDSLVIIFQTQASLAIQSCVAGNINGRCPSVLISRT